MDINFLKKPIDLLFDSTISLIKRFFIFFTLLIVILILDDKFLFSENYVIKNKLENIQRIESIKKDSINNYSLDTVTVEKLNKIESQVLENSGWNKRIFSYLKEISNGTIKVDLIMILSIQWFWILFGLIILAKTFKSKTGMSRIGELLALLFFLIIIMFVWSILFPFITGVFSINSRTWVIFVNILLNIIILIGIIKFGTKK